MPACWHCAGKTENEQWPLPAFLSGRRYHPALSPKPDNPVPLRMFLAPFKLLSQCWSSEGVVHVNWHGPFKGNCLGLQKPSISLSLNPCWFFTARSYGDFSLWHWNPGLGEPGVGLGPLALQVGPLQLKYASQFLSTTRGTGWSHLCAPPTSLDVAFFFNFLVVRLSFTQISGGSE